MFAKDVEELQVVVFQGEKMVRFPTLDDHGVVQAMSRGFDTPGLAFLPRNMFEQSSLGIMWHHSICVLRQESEVELLDDGRCIACPAWAIERKE